MIFRTQKHTQFPEAVKAAENSFQNSKKIKKGPDCFKVKPFLWLQNLNGSFRS
ncbi:hypothetical protein [Chryseobacterium sp. 'Rf worker isolate 10']|uniref:hypothetical protein n=1 Tax=Chryseobacterium sp. 'Rf worker isolate 10' TaxID=2887348 RepID=UPI003D6F018A